ncbi:hypothetical protein [Micromonospora carbonacea]|uniref:hypothetical protein n=1 Tax=Micromonospora carbonacea TaxID=47853 RepID=UPI00371856FD
MDSMLGSLGFQQFSAKMANMALDGGDWRRLGEHVVRRREELGLTQSEVHAAGGPSTATMRNIERAVGVSYRGGILRSLERALQWRTGSVEAILAGGHPLPADSSDSGDADFDTLITWLTRVANNPNREAPLRAWARTQIDALAAIREADRNEARARGEVAG